MAGESTLDTQTLETAIDAMTDRVETTLEATGEAFPYVADPESGEWDTTDDGNWCGGHWVGLLWIAGERADSPEQRERFFAAAREHARVLRESGVIESMFGGMNCAHAGFRGYDATGDRELFALGLEGADAQVAAFHEAARQLPLGEFEVHGPGEFEMHDAGEGIPEALHTSALDCIYTAACVLWRAHEETGDPRFRDVALSHADRHLDWFLREDGRLYNMAEFNYETGELGRRYNHLAHSDETCWARGMGWNVAGLAHAYDETRAGRFFDALEHCTEYYVEHSPEDLVPYWDFDAPGVPDEPRDTSSAGLVAHGLTLLPADVGGAHGERVASLRGLGDRILGSLIADYLVTDADDPRRGMVLHGCFDRPGDYAVDNELIWTDYYVASAIHDRLAPR